MSGWDIDPASVGTILESEKNTVDNEAYSAGVWSHFQETIL